MPAKSKFTAEVRGKLLEGRRIGASQEICADLAGIGGATLSRWLDRGRDADPETPYGQFYRDWLEATAHPKARALGIIYKQLPDNPTLAWKFIERQVDGYQPPMPVPPAIVQSGPVMIELNFADGTPAMPKWLTNIVEAEVVDEQEVPALGPGDDATAST